MAPPESKVLSKKSRKAISLDIKLEVIRRLNAGETISQVSSAMDLAKSTIQTVRNNEEHIKKLMKTINSKEMAGITRNRSVIMAKMESLLSTWIEDNTHRQLPMSQRIIQEKAKSLFETIKSKENDNHATFNASKGWFEKFKKRYNFHNVKLKGEAFTCDVKAAEEYLPIIKKILSDGGYLPEQVFNADKTGLYWKCMPDSTYLVRDEGMRGYRVSKERLTLLFTSNASGDFKLKPFLIYVSETPRALKNVNKAKLPVIWRSNKKAWMTKILFEEWFQTYFCPAVETYLKKKNLSNKALLFLDNAPSHPISICDFSKNIKVEFLPKNTTAILQPMDQGAIFTFKAHYLQKIFRMLKQARDNQRCQKVCWKNYNIKDAIENIDQSWKEIQMSSHNKFWQPLWPECVVRNSMLEVDININVNDVVKTAVEAGFADYTKDDVIKFLTNDREPLTNEELLQLHDLENLVEEEATISDNSIKLTSQMLKNCFDKIDEVLSYLQIADSFPQRSFDVAKKVNEAMQPYKELLKDQEKRSNS